MSAVLVLLGLLSLAMLASRRGAFDEIVARATTPILVGLGVLLSPTGLGFLTPSTLDGMDNAVEVGVCWLAILTGLRASSLLPPALRDKNGGRAAGLAVVSAAMSAVVTGGVLNAAAGLGRFVMDAGSLAPASVLVGASLAAMAGDREHNGARRAYAATAELLVVVVALGAFAYWTGANRALVVFVLGVMGASVVQLLLTRGDPSGVPPAIAYMAVTVLVAGMCRLASVPAAVAGFVLGAVAGPLAALRSAVARRSRRHPGANSPVVAEASALADDVIARLMVTERPVRIVITTVLAASTIITLPDLVIGAALGVAIVLVQFFVSLALVDGSTLLQRLGATVATSTTPLIAVAAFAGAHVDGARVLLPVVIIAVAMADAVAFTVSLAAHSETASNTADADTAKSKSSALRRAA